jgi:bacterioferritin-associated ferredoxin
VFACICRAVTCDQVTTAIDSGAVTVRAVAKATGACTGCGTCLERIVGMIDERAAAPCPLAAHAPLAAHQAPATAMAATQAA